MVRLSGGKSSRQHSRRSCLETVRTAREETTATVQANIEACILEHPEVELKMRQAAVVSQESDSAQAIESAQAD